MENAAVVKPPPAIRWMLTLAILLVCVLVIVLILGGAASHVELLRTVSLLAIALSTYAWVVSPPAGGLAASTAVFVCLQWAWAARQTWALRWDLAAFGILLAVAISQRRRRSHRVQGLLQTLDDLREERTVKDQAIVLAHQTSQAVKKKLSRYVQLQSIAAELSNMTDLMAIAQLVVDRAFALIGKSDVALLFLVDKEQQELSLFASKKRESIPSIRAKHGDQFDRHVLRTQRPLLVNDVRRDFRFTTAAAVTVATDRPISSVIACPLFIHQTPEGVLRLDSSQPGTYTQDDLRFLDILLDLVSAAVTNAKLFAQTQQLAIADGLTGLMLRRPFLEQLTRELTRSIRSREPVSVLMLDVDEFKHYNDAFGHTAGDLVLKSIAEVLRVVVPPGGAMARYGGEEFAVLLPRLTRHEAGDVAEKIRGLVEQQVQGSSRYAHHSASSGAAQEPIRVSVSIGAASFPDDAQVELERIRIADQRLYQAKRGGRNLVCAA